VNAVGAERFLEKPPLKSLRIMADTIKAFAFFGALAAGVASLAYTNLLSNASRQVLVAALLGSTGVLLGSLAATWIIFLRYYEPRPYEILGLSGTLEISPVGNHHRYVHTITKKVRATRDNLRLIEFREYWTGAGSKQVVIRSMNPDHTLLDGLHREDDLRFYRWIYIHRPIGRNRELDVGVSQVFEDDVIQQRPFFREGGGAHRVRLITVAVVFHIKCDPPQVEGAVWDTGIPLQSNNVLGSLDVQRAVDRANETVTYRVVVNRPKRGLSYGVRWNWPAPEPQDITKAH
jgi:hypothetical protein